MNHETYLMMPTKYSMLGQILIIIDPTDPYARTTYTHTGPVALLAAAVDVPTRMTDSQAMK